MKKIFFFIAMLTLLFPILVFAQSTSPTGNDTSSTPLAGPQGILSNLGACYDTGDCQICDFVTVANNIIKLILGISGGIALVVSVIAGTYLLISGGGDYKKRAYESAKAAIIGLLIIFLSYSAVNLGLNLVMGTPVTGNAMIFGSDWTEFCNNAKGQLESTPPTGN